MFNLENRLVKFRTGRAKILRRTVVELLLAIGLSVFILADHGNLGRAGLVFGILIAFIAVSVWLSFRNLRINTGIFGKVGRLS